MQTVVVTGASSGIGAAVRRRLEGAGGRVIGIDLRGSEIDADLATAAGRGDCLRRVGAAAGGRLDGLVACAGLGPHVADAAAVVSVNYFGAVAVLAGLRPLLVATRGAAVAVSSNASTLANADGPLTTACLDDDEAAARREAIAQGGQPTYAGSKLALARWVRRRATTPEWAGTGVRLNAVAPGAVRTPLLEGGLQHPVLGDAIRGFPIPTGGFGTPDDVAAAIAFLLSPDAGFCCGSVLFVDGGSDALFRPDRY